MSITNELKAKYQSLIDKGYTTKQISAEVKTSWSTIKRHFRELGLQTIHKVIPKPLQKKQLENLIEKNYSTYQIARELNRSQGSVKHWMKKYALKTCLSKQKENCVVCHNALSKAQKKYCSKKCKLSIITPRDNRVYDNQRDRGLERKKIAIEMKGGKCSICGYSKNYAGLTFHHLNPSEKEFGLDIRKFSNRSWKRLLAELAKCQLLCHNCHAEIEYPHLKMVLGDGFKPTT